MPYLGTPSLMNQYIDEHYDPNGRFGGDGFVGDIFEGIGNFARDVKTGLTNSWYKLTGQADKTSEYQANIQRENELLDRQEAREDTAMQRGVADARAAGLSAYSAVPSASGSYRSGVQAQSDQFGQIAALQNLKSNALAIKEREHNLSLSEALGIRTGDKNYAAKWAELGNVLFGFDPTTVEGGIIPYVVKMLRGDVPPELPSSETVSTVSPKTSSVPKSSSDYKTEAKKSWFEFKYNLAPSKALSGLPFGEALQGATLDQAKKVIGDLSRLQSFDGKQKSQMMSDIIDSIQPTLVSDFNKMSKGLVVDSLDNAVAFGVRQMKSKGQADHYEVSLLAEFLSRQYDVTEDTVKKKIYSLL